jgi:hypothetical protein
MCCENPPIDLGCVGSCDPIITNVVSNCATSFTMVFEFNNTLITRPLSYTGTGYVSIPPGIFPENSVVNFKLFDSAGVFINCFVVRINVGMIMTYPAGEELTSRILLTKELCQEGLPNSILPVTVDVLFNDITLLQVGSLFTIEQNYISGGVIPYAITAVSNGINVIGDMIVLQNIEDIGGNNVRLEINYVIPNCSHEFRLYLSVVCFGLVPDGVSLGIQTPSNDLIN